MQCILRHQVWCAHIKKKCLTQTKLPRNLLGDQYNRTAYTGMTTLLLSPLKSQGTHHILSLLLFLWPTLPRQIDNISNYTKLGGSEASLRQVSSIYDCLDSNNSISCKRGTYSHCLMKRHTGLQSITAITINLHLPNYLLLHCTFFALKVLLWNKSSMVFAILHWHHDNKSRKMAKIKKQSVNESWFKKKIKICPQPSTDSDSQHPGAWQRWASWIYEADRLDPE